MKIAIVSMMNNGFFIAYVGFIKSLLISNPWIETDKIPLIMIDLDIPEPTKDKMLEMYPYIEFRKPNYKMYKDVNMSKTPEVLKCTYYKLDIFSYEDYDRLIFMDLDITVIRDVKELFNEDKPFSACLGYTLQSDALRHDINSGIFVVNNEYLNQETYKGIIDVAKKGFSMPDQKAINIYFRNKINHLPKKFNCEKRMARSITFKDMWDNECCIIHWVSEKPWQSKTRKVNMGFEAIEKIWWNYYNSDIEIIT